MIDITLNEESIADAVAQGSLLITQNLTNEPDTAEFAFRITPGRTLPAFDDDVVVYDSCDKIFAGKVAETTEAIEGSMVRLLRVRCVDHTFEFDRVLVARTYENQTAAAIIADLVATYAPTFTAIGVTGAITVQKIVFNQIPLSQCMRKLADLLQYEWYIDEDRDVQFFDRFTRLAPFDLTDDGGNHVYKSLVRSEDGSQLINRVKVRGGTYNGATFTDTITVTGNDTKSFLLPYRMANLTVSVDDGGGADPQGVGIDFIDTFGSGIDVLYNFNTQSFRFETALSDGDKVTFSGNPKVEVIAIAEDSASIQALRDRYEEVHGGSAPEGYGVIEKIIRDDSIQSNSVARKRAAAELIAFSDQVVDAMFTTYTPGLRAGMLLRVSSDQRDFDDQLIIKRIQFRWRTPETYEYGVYCISTQRYTMLDVLRKVVAPAPRPEDEREVSEELFSAAENLAAADEYFVGKPPVDPDNVGSGGNNTAVTFSHTVPADGYNRMLVVGVACSGSVASVTWNGDALTKDKSQANGGSVAELWSLANPDTGTHDVVVTVGGTKAVAAGAVNLLYRKQTSYVDATGGSNGNARTVTANVTTTAPGSVIVGVVERDLPSGLPALTATDGTFRWEQGGLGASGREYAGAGLTKRKLAAGTTSVGFTFGAPGEMQYAFAAAAYLEDRIAP